MGVRGPGHRVSCRAGRGVGGAGRVRAVIYDGSGLVEPDGRVAARGMLSGVLGEGEHAGEGAPQLEAALTLTREFKQAAPEQSAVGEDHQTRPRWGSLRSWSNRPTWHCGSGAPPDLIDRMRHVVRIA